MPPSSFSRRLSMDSSFNSSDSAVVTSELAQQRTSGCNIPLQDISNGVVASDREGDMSQMVSSTANMRPSRRSIRRQSIVTVSNPAQFPKPQVVSGPVSSSTSASKPRRAVRRQSIVTVSNPAHFPMQQVVLEPVSSTLASKRRREMRRQSIVNVSSPAHCQAQRIDNPVPSASAASSTAHRRGSYIGSTSAPALDISTIAGAVVDKTSFQHSSNHRPSPLYRRASLNCPGKISRRSSIGQVRLHSCEEIEMEYARLSFKYASVKTENDHTRLSKKKMDAEIEQLRQHIADMTTEAKDITSFLNIERPKMFAMEVKLNQVLKEHKKSHAIFHLFKEKFHALSEEAKAIEADKDMLRMREHQFFRAIREINEDSKNIAMERTLFRCQSEQMKVEIEALRREVKETTTSKNESTNSIMEPILATCETLASHKSMAGEYNDDAMVGPKPTVISTNLKKEKLVAVQKNVNSTVDVQEQFIDAKSNAMWRKNNILRHAHNMNPFGIKMNYASTA